MADFLSRFPTDELIGFIAVIGAFLCGMLGIALAIVWQCLDYRKTQSATALKHEMLARGMSADEITEVLNAGTSDAARPARRCGRI